MELCCDRGLEQMPSLKLFVGALAERWVVVPVASHGLLLAINSDVWRWPINSISGEIAGGLYRAAFPRLRPLSFPTQPVVHITVTTLHPPTTSSAPSRNAPFVDRSTSPNALMWQESGHRRLGYGTNLQKLEELDISYGGRATTTTHVSRSHKPQSAAIHHRKVLNRRTCHVEVGERPTPWVKTLIKGYKLVWWVDRFDSFSYASCLAPTPFPSYSGIAASSNLPFRWVSHCQVLLTFWTTVDTVKLVYQDVPVANPRTLAQRLAPRYLLFEQYRDFGDAE